MVVCPSIGCRAWGEYHPQSRRTGTTPRALRRPPGPGYDTFTLTSWGIDLLFLKPRQPRAERSRLSRALAGTLAALLAIGGLTATATAANAADANATISNIRLDLSLIHI